MTFEEHPGDQDGSESAPTADVARRAALAAAWSSPVVAACAAAPGAAASVAPPPALPALFLGVRATDDGLGTSNLGAVRRFTLSVFVNGDGVAGTPVVLPEEARVDFTTDHDFVVLSRQVVRDSDRAGHIIVPAGSYPGSLPYLVGGTAKVAALTGGSPHLLFYNGFPQHSLVTVTVVRGPVYSGPTLPGMIGTHAPKAELTTD
ncbi:hypothetical protein [Rathayibacter sp. VKM Ac-2760]|uniref:hypothetical protein n=1 Tax=Rathayibacter sp. VKM Ac-2760 TaxID=2609253 RepID=UPI001315D6C6|nr:hypothetical protein [Rathayibacter sp. VKM Ac-2760]QHC58325.1 hypothetical protein GSU72_07020 [Rathayibacter sp. VKM Ac-2760]